MNLLEVSVLIVRVLLFSATAMVSFLATILALYLPWHVVERALLWVLILTTWWVTVTKLLDLLTWIVQHA